MELTTFSDLYSYSPQQIRHYFGGKALGLYDAHKIGIPVPTAWLISTQVHEQFLKLYRNKLDPTQTLSKSDPSSCLGVNLSMEQSAFESDAAAFIQDHLKQSLDSLEEGTYAVRSSCQTEDASHYSFAGIFETCLNVPKLKLVAAIAKVWSSPFQERAKAYSQTHALMGIVIQPMVQAKYAGVCFTVHPSPQTIFDNGSFVIEYAAASGEKVVQGEITPFRLCGTADVLMLASENSWMHGLLKAVFALKKTYHHQADIEFAIDQNDQFWMLQQRPISKVYHSQVVDLSPYKRMYKRSLLALDIELLIDGCSRFLSPYLEMTTSLERWMVMTTNEQNIQELWVHEVINETIISSLIDKIAHDKTYLPRLAERYQDHHERLISSDLSRYMDSSRSLKKRLFQWFEWITPFLAHYYVPMFVIEALHTSILRDIYPMDPLHADHDLFELGTAGIASLADLLDNELRKLKNRSSFSECESELEKLAHRFGFLKCRTVFETPYTPKELFAMIGDVPLEPKGYDRAAFEEKKTKYFDQEPLQHRFYALREWIRIRNQEMEYILFSFLSIRPLIQEVCSALSIQMEDFWRSSKHTLIAALYDPHKKGKEISSAHLAILNANGNMVLSDALEIQTPSEPSSKSSNTLKGRTVYGKGMLEAEVRVAFTPEELAKPPRRPCVLVTGMTTPDFVPLIRKHYDALITDEGGILCHAAIVAREIPIPCIVGTGLGSTTLTDGAKVRIDFDRAEISQM